MGGSSYRLTKNLAVIKENRDVERAEYGIYFVPDTKECFTSFVSGTPSKIAKYLSHNKLTSGCFYPCAEKMTNEVLEIVFP